MSAALDLRSKEEKDAELDKRIEALRKKNEALIKRYQEIEEDRKKAEQEGIAVTALRRARPPEPERRWVDKDLSVTVQEKRLAKDKKPSGTPKPGRGAVHRGLGRTGRSPRGGEQPPETLWEGAAGDRVTPGDRGGRGRRARGRGAAGPGLGGDAGPDRKSKEWEERRRQNIKKMNEEMEKIAEYERNQRDGLHEKNPVRNFLDDPRRSGPFQDADRKEGSRRHVRNWGGPDFDKVKAGMEREKTWQGPVRTPLCLLGGSQDGFGAGFEPGGRGWSCVWPQGRRASAKAGGSLDMTLSMTGRERAEYVRWKEERDQIDRERLARHRKPTGQWRREWDAEKSDSMFKEGSAAAPGSDASGEEEPKRPPPRAPTFGEFLAPPRGQRRRRGRGRAPGAGPRPYSMHDNRWEEKEPPAPAAATPSPQVEEAPSGAPPQPPHSLSPEEDEDQWEDVSEEEEEEEEEEEGGSSAASSIEDEAPRSASPKAQRPPQGAGQAPHVSVPPPGVAPAPERGAGTPPSPFSPLGGRQPVSDWGEEMDLASPRSSLGDSPLPGVPKSRGASGETPGLSPEELAEPPRGAQNPAAPPPQHEARPNAAQEVSEKPEEAATGDGAREPAEAAPGTVEITDFQRDGQAPRRPPAAPPSPGSLPL